MARLAFPPTISRLTSGTAKPASGRAPIQSAASRPTLRFAAATRTTVTCSACVSTVASRTNGACVGTLRDVTMGRKEMTDCAQKRMKTWIPRPKTMSAAMAKWAKTRWYTTTPINSRRRKSEAAECKGDEMETEEASEADVSFITDNNPKLLNDVSFDGTLKPAQQLTLPGNFARFQSLMAARFRGREVAQCAVFGGTNPFVLSRERPRVVVWWSKIPRKLESTLRYGVIDMANTTFMAAKQDFTKIFNCFGFIVKSPALPSLNSESLTVLDVELLLPDVAQAEDSEARPDSTVDIASQPTTANDTAPAPTRKAVRFHDGVQRHMYDLDAPPAAVKTPLDKCDWEPQKDNIAYPGSSVPTGFDTMFLSTSSQTIALKLKVLLRFKAVQEYENRRKQDAIAAGNDNSPSGQLEYGNVDYKLALQRKRVITVDDVGCLVDPRELGIPASTWNSGPLLHFDGLEDKLGRVFKNAYISEKAAAYKEPISWDDAPESTYALNKWTKSTFNHMQPADFED